MRMEESPDMSVTEVGFLLEHEHISPFSGDIRRELNKTEAGKMI